MTNGSSVWTCEAMSCGSALISARLNGGRCSASMNGSNPYRDDQSNTPIIIGDTLMTGSEFVDLERAFGQLEVVMNGIANKDTLNREKVGRLSREQQDSISSY